MLRVFARLVVLLPSITVLALSVYATYQSLNGQINIEQSIQFILFLLTGIVLTEFFERVANSWLLETRIKDDMTEIRKHIETTNNLVQTSNTTNKHISKGIDDILGDLRKLIKPDEAELIQLIAFPEKADVSKHMYDGLVEMQQQFWDVSRTLKAESNATQIWVASPVLKWESESHFGPIIKRRIADGDVQYYVLFIDNQENRAFLELEISPAYQKIRKDWQDFCRYVPVKPKDFIWFMEYVVYFITENNATNLHCLIVDIISSSSWSTNNFNIELSQSLRRQFLAQFVECWNTHVNDANWRIKKEQIFN